MGYGEQTEQEKKCPIAKGDRVTLKCEAIGEKGDGLFRKDGFVIFVPGTEKGKSYEIEITKVLTKVAFGEVLRAA